MKTVDSILDKILIFIMVASAAVLTGVTFAGVVARFVLHMSIKWSSDMTRWSFIYAVFFGASYAAKTNSHLNLDVVLTALPTKVKQVIELLINILLTAFCCLIAVLGAQFTKSGLTQRMPYLNMPISVLYVALPINGAIMAFFYLQHAVEKIRELVSGKGGMNT